MTPGAHGWRQSLVPFVSFFLERTYCVQAQTADTPCRNNM